MNKKFVVAASVAIIVSGCASTQNAWNSRSLEKVMGTKDPSFILNHETFSLHLGVYPNNPTKPYYSKSICDKYNADEQLKLLKQEGVIDEYPICQLQTPESSLKIEVGTTKEKCILQCMDRYIRYTDESFDLKAYSVVKNVPYMDAIDYSVGHIKNMVITANIDANRDNPEWKANLKRACKKNKKLRSVCE